MRDDNLMVNSVLLQQNKESQIVLSTFGEIPIRNIWFFLLYASDLYRQLEKTQRVSLEESPDELPDLIAEMIIRAVKKKVKKNLTTNYEIINRVQSRVRGKINIADTYTHRLMDRGQVSCRYTHLTANTPRNCFFRSALEHLSSVVTRKDLSRSCRSLARQFIMLGITGPTPSRAALSKERIGRNDASDALLLSLARLAFELRLPTQQGGRTNLHYPDITIRRFRTIFEKGIAGFYATILDSDNWKVTAGKKMSWQIDSISNGMKEILPSMKSDIQLDHKSTGRRIIIDTKSNSLLVNGWYRDKSIRNGYLYQIYTYLRSQEDANDPISLHAEGLLLHPAITTTFDEYVDIQGHRIRFLAVDFSRTIQEIRNQLLQVIQS
jgi:5-methylcytosine-specific restriction enzyme subunit McrC